MSANKNNKGAAQLIERITTGQNETEPVSCENCGWCAEGLNLVILGDQKEAPMKCPSCGKIIKVLRKKKVQADKSTVEEINRKACVS